MKKLSTFNMYTCIEDRDYRFSILYEIFQGNFRPYQLINWFFDQQNQCNASEGIWINKENNKIVLYDVSDSMDDEYTGPYLNPDLRFEMSRQNFIDLLYHWEELRFSKPDTILVVIHEDNHVTLETDPVVIKHYQDGGYAFDINKK